MNEYDDMSTGAEEVLEDVHAARAEIEAIIEELSPEQMTQATDEGGWAIKDHLIHIAEWQNRAIGIFENRTSWESLEIDEETYRSSDIDSINDIIFKRHQNRDLKSVLTEFRKSQERVVLTLEQLNEDDLERPTPTHIRDEYPRLIDLIEANFAGHDRDHVEDIRQLANEPLD
ncbi:MAG: ClbS/DfsB family four-helix bundle protein [Sphaerobacteraceae bacterium]|nr:MAG: ClbS/DfsB family four-helix bundle protein [Sphaerobacteraceae bacterium]